MGSGLPREAQTPGRGKIKLLSTMRRPSLEEAEKGLPKWNQGMLGTPLQTSRNAAGCQERCTEEVADVGDLDDF